MRCQRCGAIKITRQNYCTNCIAYGKMEFDKKIEYPSRLNNNYEYKEIKLSNDQELISKKLMESKGNILVDAVCGAGKTEMCLAIISKYLKEGKRVGFAIPRKEVVKDIGNRLKELFSKNIVTILHGDIHDKKIGDITVLTCHQCANFTKAFDLLIIDEPDAFPYEGNLLLQKITEASAVEKIVYLSATPPIELVERDIEVISINKRYHGRKHPVPEVIEVKNIEKKVKQLIKDDQKNLIFTPTIKLQEYLASEIDIKALVNSKLKTNFEMVRMLEMGLIKNIITTATLERGITIAHCNVIIAYADHINFNADAIVQMCGRVNRKVVDDKCHITIVCQRKTYQIKKALKEIERRNEL